MFGSNPGIFKNRGAAKMAGIAYQMETKKEHVLIFKEGYFQPCEVSDIEFAKKEGYEVVEYLRNS